MRLTIESLEYAPAQRNVWPPFDAFASVPLGAWLLIGFMLRLPGILFVGMRDVDQFILEWGAAVNYRGLGTGFQGIYGHLTYALLGPAYAMAELAPRFWNAPFKLMEIGFEFVTLLALWRISPLSFRKPLALLYWANPWFALHGAWHGFWDAPHTLAGLLAVVAVLGNEEKPAAWFSAGALLAVSAQFKPQGLVFFLVPATMYLGIEFILHRRTWIGPFVTGASVVFLSASALATVTGGSFLDVAQGYAQLRTVAPNLSNGAINVWTPVTSIIQLLTGQSGPPYTLVLDPVLLRWLHLFSAIATLGAVAVICWRAALSTGYPAWDLRRSDFELGLRAFGITALGALIVGLVYATRVWHSVRRAGLLVLLAAGIFAALFFVRRLAAPVRASVYRIANLWPVRQPRPDQPGFGASYSLFLVLALSAIVMPQFSTRMHVNHAYAGLVFLLPLAIAQRSVLQLWLPMVGIHFFIHLAKYEFGRALILPPRFGPDAGPIVDALTPLQAHAETSSLLAVQAWLNRATHLAVTFNEHVSVISAASVLSFIMFILVVILLRRMAFPVLARSPVTVEY